MTERVPLNDGLTSEQRRALWEAIAGCTDDDFEEVLQEYGELGPDGLRITSTYFRDALQAFKFRAAKRRREREGR